MVNRRTFFKTGLAAGTGLTMASYCTSSFPESSPPTQKISANFSVQKLTGTVTLECESKIPENSSFHISVHEISSTKFLVNIQFHPMTTMVVKRFSIIAAIPETDIHRIWYSQQFQDMGWLVYVGLPWVSEIQAAGNEGSFVAQLQNRHAKNKVFLGLKDQTGDGSIQFAHGYAQNMMQITFNRFAKGRTYTTNEINQTLYIDLEGIPWNRAINNFVEWYDREWKLSYYTPVACYDPLFYTYYTNLGNITDEFLVENSAKAKELGFKTIIIDTGWEMANGDWVPNPKHVPDFKNTVKKIQAMGLKVIIYYHPFNIFMNSETAKEYAQYRTVINGAPTDRLCPRCKAVQEHVGIIAGNIVETYKADGIKIDFLDASVASAPLVNCEAAHKHDFDFVSDGVREAMRLMKENVLRANPDALIEYRINYSNIANRQFANCHRGQDTPTDPELNRRHLTLNRTWCRNVAAHSDPGFWSPEESNENVARYLAGLMLCGVPQIGSYFQTLPQNHLSLLKSWLAFYNEHKLRMAKDGQLDFLSDDFVNSATRISSPGFTYFPIFTRGWPSLLPVLKDSSNTIFIFNGTEEPRIYGRISGVNSKYELTTTDIFLQSNSKIITIESKNGVVYLDHPVVIGGMVQLRKV